MSARLLVLMLACSCAYREPGLRVDVLLEVHSRASAAFDTATLSIEQLALELCAGQANWLQRLNPIGTAWAHSEDAQGSMNPRVSTESRVVSLQSGERQRLASLQPPPGAVCAVTITVAPSRSDSRSRGTSVLLEQAGFLQLSAATVTRRVPVADVVLDEAHRSGELTLSADFFGPAGSGEETVHRVLDSLESLGP